MYQPIRLTQRPFNLSSLFSLLFLFAACGEKKEQPAPSQSQEESSALQKVIFDTDANNELDDQHALAYLLFNGDTFEVDAVTVNATYNGGEIEEHYQEAERVLQLCNMSGSIPLLHGANASFAEISESWNPENYDGKEAVDRLLTATQQGDVDIIAVGKLTNVALAIKADKDFTNRTRIIWLGSNYPEPGEYNQDNDTVAMNYVLNSGIPFEMVTVRYGDPSGTDAVSVTQTEINEKMPGLGPLATTTVIGRHGGEFNRFGDYSVDLFKYIDYHGDPPSRALFDMVAVAILKNPDWGEKKMIPAPVLIDNQWVERPNNPRQIMVWENFDKEGLLKDFFNSIQDPKPVNTD